jgi:excisionase family DNA binding protein
VNKTSLSLPNFVMPLDKVADALGVSVYTIRRLVAANRIPAVRIGARIMVCSDTVARIQREGTQPSSATG